ncbi:unnamed protein product [Prunus armeniaca]
MIGQAQDKFVAAAARNPVCNLAIMVGRTDIPDWRYAEAYGSEGQNSFTDAPSAEHLTLFQSKFPIAHVSKVKTPTLLLLGALDLRAPVSTGLQYALALKEKGVPVKVIVFPNDTHAIERTLTKPSTAITSIFFSISMERTELAVENNDLPRLPPDLAVEENIDLDSALIPPFFGILSPFHFASYLGKALLLFKHLHDFSNFETRTSCCSNYTRLIHEFGFELSNSARQVKLFTKPSKWEGRSPWNIMFVFTCWYVWKWHNQYIFNDAEDLPCDPRKIICAAVLDWVKASSVNCRNVPRTQVMLRWEPPGSGWVKLNVDGTCMNVSGKIGAGGVIRDCFGEWCGGFCCELGEGAYFGC